jgi:hypothetical protein
MYIAWLYQKHLSYKSARTYLAGLSYFHKLNNWIDPTASFYIKTVMEGYQRKNFHADVRLPITIEMLGDLCTALNAVCTSGYETRLFRALFLVAFFGLFRISELVATSQNMFQHSLQTSDLRLQCINGTKIAYFTLRKSKKNQCGSPHVITISGLQKSQLCPVKAIVSYLGIKPLSIYLFCHANSHPVTKFQFSLILKECLNYLGFPSKRILSHSFRIGAASYLDSMGIPHDVIMEKGRWTSNSYAKYIRK